MSYLTLRCKLDRHDLCVTHAESRCMCECHSHTLPFPDNAQNDAGSRLERSYEPLRMALAAVKEQHI